jgi:hypothetical protein
MRNKVQPIVTVSPEVVEHFRKAAQLLYEHYPKHELLRFAGPETANERVQKEFIKRFLNHPQAQNLADALLLCAAAMIKAAQPRIRI